MEPNAASRKVRVLVADSSRIHSQLLANALQQDPDLVIVSSEPGSANLFSAIVSQKVDVLAISSSFGGRAGAGLKIVRDLRFLHPGIRMVVLLDSQDAQLGTDALRAGARGVFNRAASMEMFAKCIRSVERGEIWADHHAISLAVDALASTPIIRTMDSGGLNLLSKREFQVVECVVQGMTNREIAQRLGLSQHTVKNYLFRVFDKLGVSSRVELLFIALRPNHQSGNRDSQSVPRVETLQQLLAGPYNESALACLERAADQGVAAAQWLLAQVLAERDDPAESINAYMWFSIAAEQGRQARMQLATKLNLQQIEEAQRKAGKWLTRATQSDSRTLSGILPKETDRIPEEMAAPMAQQVTQLPKSDTSRPAEPQAPTQLVPTY